MSFKDDMQRFFLPTWLKVVSSCVLQYRPVCVTNFDKLCRVNAKNYKFIGLFGIAILRHVWRHTCICLFCLHCYALLRLDRKLILPVCFKNLFLCRYAYVLCNVSLDTSIACSLVCLPGMTSSLTKVNKSSGAHFLALFLKFPNFLMLLNIWID